MKNTMFKPYFHGDTKEDINNIERLIGKLRPLYDNHSLDYTFPFEIPNPLIKGLEAQFILKRTVKDEENLKLIFRFVDGKWGYGPDYTQINGFFTIGKFKSLEVGVQNMFDIAKEIKNENYKLTLEKGEISLTTYIIKSLTVKNVKII